MAIDGGPCLRQTGGAVQPDGPAAQKGSFWGERLWRPKWLHRLDLLSALCFYVYHRTSHEIRLFWANHVAHHSSESYTLATALRQSWTAPFIATWFWTPLPLLGFRPEHVLLMSAISLLYQYGLHTETVDRLGPIEWVMNTPSHHRVHHGSNPQYIDRNHAGIFILWDRLFGTFEPEVEKPVYGITTPVGSHNPVVVQFDEFIAIARDVFRARSLREAIHAIVRNPGDVPAVPAE